MAIVGMTSDAILARPSSQDQAKFDATTEEDIRRHMVEDGEDPDATLPPGRLVVPPAFVRHRLGMTQPQFASLIGVPLGTLRNWEQGRGRPDASARALFIILAREPEAALRALQPA